MSRLSKSIYVMAIQTPKGTYELTYGYLANQVFEMMQVDRTNAGNSHLKGTAAKKALTDLIKDPDKIISYLVKPTRLKDFQTGFHEYITGVKVSNYVPNGFIKRKYWENPANYKHRFSKKPELHHMPTRWTNLLPPVPKQNK